MQFNQLGIEGYPLASELILTLGGPQLSVDLPSVDPHLLLLLVGLLLVGEELHTWLWHSGPHSNHQAI
jgi:hypothetical protein